MIITYSWEFPRFNIYNNLNGLSRVVYNIEWILIATDNEGHGEQITGSTNLDSPDPSSFVPFLHITKDRAEIWIEDALGNQLNELKDILKNKIEMQRSPTTESVGHPW